MVVHVRQQRLDAGDAGMDVAVDGALRERVHTSTTTYCSSTVTGTVSAM